jgi:hypothetical protein
LHTTPIEALVTHIIFAETIRDLSNGFHCDCHLVHWSKKRPDFCAAYTLQMHQRPSSKSSNAPHEIGQLLSPKFLNDPPFEA